jgi:hypothetical protein
VVRREEQPWYIRLKGSQAEQKVIIESQKNIAAADDSSGSPLCWAIAIVLLIPILFTAAIYYGLINP